MNKLIIAFNMTYVISDLHGYSIEKLKMLLKKANFGEDDFLYILGDVIDRNGDGGVVFCGGCFSNLMFNSSSAITGQCFFLVHFCLMKSRTTVLLILTAKK